MAWIGAAIAGVVAVVGYGVDYLNNESDNDTAQAQLEAEAHQAELAHQAWLLAQEEERKRKEKMQLYYMYGGVVLAFLLLLLIINQALK